MASTSQDPQVGADCDYGILPDLTGTQTSTVDNTLDACPSGNVCCQYSAANCYCRSDSGERDCTDDATRAPCTSSFGPTPNAQVGADCDYGIILPDLTSTQTSAPKAEPKASSHIIVGHVLDALRNWF